MTSPQPTPPPGTSPSSRGGDDKNRYKATLNLPKTTFPMKASLVQNEPASIKRWEAMGLYDRLRRERAGKPRFVFHDGPPYANASLHLGHLLNRIMKDIVVRSRTLMGLDCPFVPGWDCHGLPIEHRVISDMVEKGRIEKLKALTDDQRRIAIRRECQAHAEKSIKLQAGQMVRMLTLADYPHPYKTMSPEYEGAVLEVLAALLERGLVYRALKPVHWSIANETALAEAELEYYEREDPSIYVDFEAADPGAVYDAFGLPAADASAEDDSDAPEDEIETDASEARLPRPGTRPTQTPTFMIWTTTPWTLPANLAIAVNPRFVYALVHIDGNLAVLAQDAVERVTRAARSEAVRVLATTTGDRLVGLGYRHPFARSESARAFRLVPADYVTLEDGTGLVHTAPGHGSEDYHTGLREGLPVYCPVRADGTYDATVPEWLRGLDIWKANELILGHLRESGHLFYHHAFTHSYPHDWRGKTPVIFRCTEQWFISVDRAGHPDQAASPGAGTGSLRAMALAATEPGGPVRFLPEWGRNRMRGMLESRPDWCISRQRAWGLPIPAFFCADAEGREQVFMTGASVRAVARAIRERGSDHWFTGAPEDLLRHYDPDADPDAPPALFPRHASPEARLSALGRLRKGPDILDVWFESGSSWNAVMRERSGGGDFPCDLYLEGSDQHRGWFQSSLLPALGMMGRPPYRAILTHGFMVDKDGHKMSKSLGNTIEVEDLLKEHGADVCRWWVASLSYENDIKVDKSYFDIAGESYRKVRNTLRFMLSNLDDFVPAPGEAACGCGRLCVPLEGIAPSTLEAWILAEFDALRGGVLAAYEAFDFQSAHKLLYDFCNDTLSATYLGAIKDRLYCDRVDSPRRRRTQTALYHLTDGLCRLLAPILCHTADEAYRALRRAGPDDAGTCVHLLDAPAPTGVAADPAWPAVLAARQGAQTAMERAKAGPESGGLGVENPLDMGVVLPDPAGVLARFDAADLADLLGVSRVTTDGRSGEVRVQDLRAEARCERSWKRDGTVRARSDGGMLSDRDAAALGL